MVEIEELGRAPLAPVLVQMRRLWDEVNRGAPGRVLLVEHEPVFTAGRATPPGELRPDMVVVERGGKVTYHGPGQLVVYPVMRLPRQDVRDWLQRLERFGVAVAAAFGLAAEPSANGTGVFVAGRKVASIGVAVRRWINLHGIAINVAMDLAPWHSVLPCGLQPEIMTDLSTAGGRPIAMAAARTAARAQVSVLVAGGDPL